eukprot:TRINITY_DN17793_c0_g1_i1.p1 TRINITY_DN17793_c0_g1~~TRINITY_DN17793_c0_g1_i1.p1  ORF type:complete len:655 (-),score=166.38 TRINITY_DN17793_c0_g1_i1:118-2082(-)
MSSDEPACKKRLLDSGQAVINEPVSENLQQCLEASINRLHLKIEDSYPLKCLCGVPGEDLQTYIQLNQTKLPLNIEKQNNFSSSSSYDSCLLYLNFLAWIGQVFHDQLLGGEVCLRVQSTIQFLVEQDARIENLLNLLKIPDQNIQYSVMQAITSLLPLCHCGVDLALPHSDVVLKKIIGDIIGNQQSSNSLLESLAPGEEAGLDGFDFGFEDVETSPPVSNPDNDDLEHKSWLLSILAGFVNHGGRQREDSSDSGNSSCNLIPLDEEMLCQEMQVKCLVIRAMDPIWPQFTGCLLKVLSSNMNTLASEIFLSEGFKVWRCLISVRANLSFVESRVFTTDLHSCLPQLSSRTAPSVWRTVLDTVSECLCYGTTLGLQSIPPQEPCNLAHVIIRLVRFNSFLSLVPHQSSIGFGGSAGSSQGQEQEQYDKGLVQKVVLIVLKCVALTTREARVESSSGESDSSASSRESISSGGSDMIIIERTMSGMYKVLDAWIKDILPVLPHQSLQESLLHLLQEQDDVLIEGLLCLLDTHMALYIPGKKEPEPGLLDTNPTRGFLTLLNLISRDSSVLLDFLVSNETCFLLYLLRYLKFVVKDWSGFVSSCDTSYSEAIQILIDLKQSIQRLLSKSLFPYNIGPVFRLLEKVESFHLNQKDS